MLISDESRTDDTFIISPNSSISPTVAFNTTLSSSSSNPPGKLSSFFHISSTISTAEPGDSQSANSRSLSSTGPRPMSSSAFTSNQSFIASRPTRAISTPEDSNNDITTSMPSSTTSPIPTTTGRQNNGSPPDLPATTSSKGDSENSVSDPPSKTPTKGNSQSSKTSGSSSPGATKPTTSGAAKSTPTATGGGKKGSTDAKQTVSSTVEVISVRPSDTSTILMTITSSPATTLSVPSSIPVTNTNNGEVVLSAPSLITILSTSTGSDGAFVTQTQLVANPPVTVDGKASSGFLAHHGQVAGVFTVVGVLAAAFVFALIWFIRRHRRRQRRREWFASLRQYPPSPFAQASPNSQMRSVHTPTETIHDPHTVNYENIGYRPRTSLDSTAEGSAGLGLVGSRNTQAGVLVPLRRPLSGGDPFRDPPHVPRNTPVSFSPNYDKLYGSPSASIAPSSPSIYPESLPPTGDTTTDSQSPVDSEPKAPAKYFSEPLLRRSLSVTSHPDAPPRPPRSHLRESQKVNNAIPITPPASVSSGHSDPEPQFLFHPMRRNVPHTRR